MKFPCFWTFKEKFWRQNTHILCHSVFPFYAFCLSGQGANEEQSDSEQNWEAFWAHVGSWGTNSLAGEMCPQLERHFVTAEVLIKTFSIFVQSSLLEIDFPSINQLSNVTPSFVQINFVSRPKCVFRFAGSQFVDLVFPAIQRWQLLWFFRISHGHVCGTWKNKEMLSEKD